MNYDIKNVIFKIKYDEITKKYSILKMYYDKIIKVFKVISHLGDGTYGKVYLIQDINTEVFALKVSTIDSEDTIIDEVHNIHNLFKNNNVNHPYYPICYGRINNDIGVCVVYQYFGFYNLENIKNITLNESIFIIKELLKQLNNINKSIIHGDLKSSNVVLHDKTKEPMIIDFGLTKSINDKNEVISTYYISSPESLLTLSEFKKCIDKIEELDISKHDYIGLFTIIISMYTVQHFWTIAYNYLVNHVKIKNEYLNKDKAIIVFVYMWYKFNYINPTQIINKSLYNLILKIEDLYPNIKNKHFINFLDFYNLYIVSNLKIDLDKDLLYDFLSKIIKFEPENRPSIDDLMKDHLLMT
jgi:serine/threonine protein kinase